MLLRSSSTPILGSLLSDNPNRDFDTTPNNNNSDHLKKISFSHATHLNFTSFFCNSSPITPSIAGFSDLDSESNTKSSIGFRRVQSEGNLQGLIAAASAHDMDEFHASKPPLRSSRRPHTSMLQTIPSFSIYSSKNGHEEEEEYSDEEEEEEEGSGFNDRDGLLKRSITIGDNIKGVGSGEFSFGNNMDQIEEENLHNFGVNDEEGEPKSPPLYLARGLGIDFGFGGGCLAEFGERDCDKSNMEEYYQKMVEENPGNSLFLRNYAQFLYQSKGNPRGAEEYYSRAILSDPGDGELLSQYAKLVWELHHDHERASSYYERAVEVAPEDSHVLAAYASFLWETENEYEEESSRQEDLGGISVFQSRVMTSASA